MNNNPGSFGGNFTPDQSQKASVAIYEQVRQKILSGELEPGDKLPPERDLIDMFQRSRPTVREALRMLESKNYVTISRGKGTIVNKPSTVEAERTLNSLVRLNLVSVQNVIDVRHACESLAVSLAAQNRSDDDIRVIGEILETAEKMKNDFNQFMLYGIKLNGAIAKASHNEMLYLVNRITSAFSHDKMSVQAEHVSTEKKDQISHWINEQHHDIFNAIKAQDAEAARELNEHHIECVSKALFEM